MTEHDAQSDVPLGEVSNGDDENDKDDEGLLGRAKRKVDDVLDTPEGADYDTGRTNPVTGQRRIP